MIVTSHSDNVLSGISGERRIWSLSDGYIEMPADLLRDPQKCPGAASCAGRGFACLSIASPSQVQALMAF
jgi:hypothetical protein